MTRHIGRRRTIGALSIGAALICFFGSHISASADVQGDLEVLTLAAKGHTANKERILTWTGTVAVTDESVEDSVARTDRSSATFAFDERTNSARWNWKYEERSVTKDGTTHVEPLMYINKMRKGDTLYQLGLELEKNRRHHLSVQPAKELRKFRYTENMEPMWYFTHNGMEMSDRLEFFRDNASSIANNWTVARNGPIVTIQMEPNEDQVWARYKIDLSKGCGIVSYEDEGQGLQVRWQYDYENQGGIWVPKLFKLTSIRVGDEPKSFARTIEWSGQKVNQTISDDEFTLAKLGVTPGDRVYDAFSGVRYMVGDLPLSAVISKAPTPDARVFPLIPAIASLVVLCAVVVGWKLLRRRTMIA